MAKAESNKRNLTAKAQGIQRTKWQRRLKEKVGDARTLEIHSIVHEAAGLEKEYSKSSVEAALSPIASNPRTLLRLRRTAAIPLSVFKTAANTFAATKRKTAGDPRSSKHLSVTYLEAFGRCEEDGLRRDLLTQCAKEGWTVSQLKREIVDSSGEKAIRPLVLATAFVKASKELQTLLDQFDKNGLLAAIPNIKKHDRAKAQQELKAADQALMNLKSSLAKKAALMKQACSNLSEIEGIKTSKPKMANAVGSSKKRSSKSPKRRK